MNTVSNEQSLLNNAIHFPSGLPGFPECRDYLMVQQPEERPFAWMQAVADPNLSFAVVDAYAWMHDFTLEVDDSILEEMGSLNPLDYAVYFILQIGRKDERTSFQARSHAPVIVNVQNRQARQIVVASSSTVEKAEALCLLV